MIAIELTASQNLLTKFWKVYFSSLEKILHCQCVGVCYEAWRTQYCTLHSNRGSAVEYKDGYRQRNVRQFLQST